MSKKRVSLYDRLPEIYRLRDEEQSPPGQLKQFLGLVEEAFGEIHQNIEALYHDLFIDTCEDWVIPYIGDLLGVTHLKGDSWTLRADVADTIALRRRKGTLASIERLTYNLTGWGVHCVELRENLVWAQHLNHQRPDEGGDPPYGLPTITRFTPIRGGTMALRDPAMLSLLGSPFDPFAHFADVKPPARGNIRYNLPNLAVFLWRLNDYRVPAAKPVCRMHEVTPLPDSETGEATHFVYVNVHPLGRPLPLFNTNQFDPDLQPPVISEVDKVPSPIPMVRLNQNSPAGRPECYLAIDTFSMVDPELNPLEINKVGLQLHIPESEFSGQDWPLNDDASWSIKGANLCAWENGLPGPVLNYDLIVDPVIGRILIGVDSPTAAEALVHHLMVTYTYGAVGPVGAHPTSRFSIPAPWDDLSEPETSVTLMGDAPLSLSEALSNLHDASSPVIIEIKDSLTHVLDLEDPDIQLNRSLLIRASADERPIIQLRQPLRFRPVMAGDAANLTVRLEGLYLTRYEPRTLEEGPFPAGEPLIARAAINRLELINCTLDPGGHRTLDGSEEGGRTPILDSLILREPYGFEGVEDEIAFDQTPEVIIQRSITGPLLLDSGYRLSIKDSIIDAGPGIVDDLEEHFVISNATDPLNAWGPPTQVEGVTFLGPMRVERISGKGGIWVAPLEVHNDQVGCIKFSYFCGHGDRLPQNHGCVDGTDAALHFVSEIFGQPGYGQLTHCTDFRIRERGPRHDAMGAYGFLLEAHKWRNLKIRYREFMPVGVRALPIPVT